MTDRRTFLAAAGAAGLAGFARADEPKKIDPKTWLTYAVNVEMTFGNMPFLDRLKKVAEAGFSHYEFWPWKGKDIAAMAKLDAELGLTPVQFTGFWGITAPGKRGAVVQAMKDALPVAEQLGVKMVTIVAGETTNGLSVEEMDRAVIDNLKAAAEVLAPAGITIILEPLNVLVDHPGQHVINSAHAARILKAVGSPHVKMLFDVYHQQISEGNLTGNIRKYKDLIGYYQIADHPGRNEPATGEINYPHVLRTIHDVGYKGAIGLEFRPKSDPMAAMKAVREADAAAKAHG